MRPVSDAAIAEMEHTLNAPVVACLYDSTQEIVRYEREMRVQAELPQCIAYAKEYQQKHLALCMGFHPRLGLGCPYKPLDPKLIALFFLD